jgi:predicted ATPase
MRHGVETLRSQNVVLLDGLIKIALAEAEERAGDVDRALAILDEALATSTRTGHRTFDAELHRVRGDTLLTRDSTNPAPAEAALARAIEIAGRQGTRSFGLRAALSLARLFQSTGRPAEADAALAPALENFAPTPEMREIAETQALLAALADSEEVKVDRARRERRLHLQTAYGQALIWSKGFLAEETQAAFARAAELVEPSGACVERYQVYYAQVSRSWFRGEMILARKLAESFVQEAEAKGHVMEAAVAHRMLGQVCLGQGELALAQNHCERALALHVPERDMDARRVFGTDTNVIATSYLVWSTWLLGEVDDARRLIEQVVRDARASDHAVTIAQSYSYLAVIEIFRDDPTATLRAAEEGVEFSRTHGLPTYVAYGEILSSWARGRLLDPRAGARELRDKLEAYLKQGFRLLAPWFYGMIAELEAMADHVDDVLTTVDQGLELAQETGERWKDPLLFRRKGEILLQRDSDNLAPAEEAFQAAIASAKQQGSRSWGLRAALSLAKLYQSTARPADAHAILAPALEGFSLTPEMREIAEAQALLERLA